MGHLSFVCTFYFSIVLLAVFILRTRGPGRVRGSVSNLSPVRWGWSAANTVSLHRGKTGGVSDLSIYYLDHWLFFVISCTLSIPKQRIALGESRYLWGYLRSFLPSVHCHLARYLLNHRDKNYPPPRRLSYVLCIYKLQTELLLVLFLWYHNRLISKFPSPSLMELARMIMHLMRQNIWTTPKQLTCHVYVDITFCHLSYFLRNVFCIHEGQ